MIAGTPQASSSALAAVFLRDGGMVSRKQADILSAALHPFGAHADVWRGGPAALVSRTSAADPRPAAAGEGSPVVFDGFLRRRGELAAALGLAPGEADRQPDGALFARAWARWGADAAARADGEFVFAAWNGPARTLVAGCSPWTASPLCFHVNGRRVVVASAPRGVFALGDLPRRLDDERLSNSLGNFYSDPHRTYYRDVRNLRPGEMLTVTPETHGVRRYHDPAAHVRRPAGSVPAGHVEETWDLLRRAVRSALRAGDPAVLLSGGLDSPAVALAALDVLAESPAAAALLSFTSHPEPGWDGRAPAGMLGDERPPVRELAARHPALDARFVDAAGLGFDHLLEPTIALAEVPPRNVMNLVWVHECMRLARAAGRRAVLTGEGGNLSFSLDGHQWPAELLGAGRLRALWRAVGAAREHVGGVGAARFLLRCAVLPWLPPFLQRARPAARRRAAADAPPFGAVHPGYARATRLTERARAQGGWPYRPLPRSCAEAQLQGHTSVMRQSDGRALKRALATLHGVALREPLTDRRLVEWCLGLPGEAFFAVGRPRLLARRVLRGRVPAALFSAPRGTQAADWHLRLTRALPGIRALLDDWRGDPEVAERIDLDRLSRLLDTWPARTPLSVRDHPEFPLAKVGLEHALAIGTFIRWVGRGYEKPPDEPR